MERRFSLAPDDAALPSSWFAVDRSIPSAAPARDAVRRAAVGVPSV